MVDEKAYDLLRVLKDVTKEELITKLNQIKKLNDTHISHLFLDEYFKSKDASVSPDIYLYEAQCIVNIFPQYSVEYIQSMLETLGSENNRVIIILRQLLKNEPINNFVIPNGRTLLHNQHLPDYMMHNESIEPCISSSISLPKCDINLGNTYDSKQETVTSIKRKLSMSQSKPPKIKIVPMASISNRYIPETYTASTNMNNILMPAEPCTSYNTDSSTSTQFQVGEYGFTSEVNPIDEIFKNLTPDPASELFSHSNSLDLTYRVEECGFMPEVKPNTEIKNVKPVSASELYSTDSFLQNYLFGMKDVDNISIEQPICQREPLNLMSEASNNQNLNPTSTNNLPLVKENVRSDATVAKPVKGPDNNPYNLSKPGIKLYKDSEGNWNRGNEISSTVMTEAPKLERPALEVRKKLKAPNMNARLDQNMLEISSEDDEIWDNFGYSSEEESSTDITLCNGQEASYDSKLISKIMEMFPDASPAYVKELCVGKTATATDVEDVLHIMLSKPDYPKRKQREPSPDPDLDLEKQVSLFKEVLPDADPNYLQYHAELYLQDKKKLAEFVSNALETRNYPTMKEYLRKQQLSAQVKQYTTEFNIEKFLEIIPDPDSYFNDPKKKSSVLINDRVEVFSLHYATGFLKNLYTTIPIKTINYIFSKQNEKLIDTVKELDKVVASKKGLLKSRRKGVSVDYSTTQNIPLLQEIAYLSHRTEIQQYLEEKVAKERKDMELAKVNGLLRTCNCCYNDEVMPKNIVRCTNGCDFCSECVKTSAEITFGEGKLEFPCLLSCGSYFSLQTLKDVLSPKMFSKMAQKKQLEEVKAAGIEELEMCPFCDFATIPAPGDKLFMCLNPECMKESCRQCKEPSHVPLRCDEIEKDDDVKRRTYIENKMTEALIRICYKCGMKFIKADGCNKMTCSCGAMMCYVCGKPVKDYKHFNGQGGDQYHLCPLYSDTNKLHKDAVIKGAEQAKADIGVGDNPRKLKIDPTADLHQHYSKSKKTKAEATHDMLADGIAAARGRLNNMNELIATLEWANAIRRQRYRNPNPNRRHHHHRF